MKTKRVRFRVVNRISAVGSIEKTSEEKSETHKRKRSKKGQLPIVGMSGIPRDFHYRVQRGVLGSFLGKKQGTPLGEGGGATDRGHPGFFDGGRDFGFWVGPPEIVFFGYFGGF